MFVREATPEEVPAVLGVLDAAALATDHAAVERSVARGETLVAVAGDPDRPGTVVGALVLAGERIENVAVRRRRRGQGVGRALVEAAAARRERLVAECDAGAVPFYEALGFAVSPLDGAASGDGERDDGERYRAVRESG
ncbi:MAG: GNAT family N-acetyltransferase [Haloarculaceae archaeon]